MPISVGISPSNIISPSTNEMLKTSTPSANPPKPVKSNMSDERAQSASLVGGAGAVGLPGLVGVDSDV